MMVEGMVPYTSKTEEEKSCTPARPAPSPTNPPRRTTVRRASARNAATAARVWTSSRPAASPPRLVPRVPTSAARPVSPTINPPKAIARRWFSFYIRLMFHIFCIQTF